MKTQYKHFLVTPNAYHLRTIDKVWRGLTCNRFLYKTQKFTIYIDILIDQTKNNSIHLYYYRR